MKSMKTHRLKGPLLEQGHGYQLWNCVDKIEYKMVGLFFYLKNTHALKDP